MAPWNTEELEVVLELVRTHGTKWNKISEHLATRLPNRNIKQVRNTFIRLLEGQKRMEHGTAKHKCKTCGEPKVGHVCGGHKFGNIALMVLNKKNENRKQRNRINKKAPSSASDETESVRTLSIQSSNSSTEPSNASMGLAGSSSTSASSSDIMSVVASSTVLSDDEDDDFCDDDY